MIRVETRLSEQQYSQAKQEASRLGMSVPQFLRHALNSTLSLNANKPWMRYAGMVASGNSRSSRDIDAIAYDTKRP